MNDNDRLLLAYLQATQRAQRETAAVQLDLEAAHRQIERLKVEQGFLRELLRQCLPHLDGCDARALATGIRQTLDNTES